MTKAELAIGLLSVGTVCALAWDTFGDACLHRERNRGEALALYHAVEPGMRAAVVDELRRSGRYPHLTLRGDQDQGWYISTPLEFGAKNWVLLLDVGDAHITSVRIRTEDGLHDHPVDAPADKNGRVTPRPGTAISRAVEH